VTHAAPTPTETRTRVATDLLGAGLVVTALIALPVAPTDLDRHQFPKELALHLSVLAAACLAGRASLRGMARLPLAAALGLVVVSVVSSLAATNPWLALRATGLTATGATAFLLAHHLARRGTRSRLIGWVTVAMLLGIGSALAQAWGVEHPFFARLRAPGGTLGNRNFVAHLAAITLPLAATLLLATRRRLATTAAALLFTVAIVALVMTRSRAGWLAAGTAFGSVTLLLIMAPAAVRHQLARRHLAVIPALALIGVVLAVAVPNTLEWRSDSPYRDTLGNLANYREGSGRGRLLQYQHSLELARQHPLLGVGPGNWPLHYGDVAPANDPSWARNDVIPLNPWPSSDWVALLSERGVLAPLCALLVGCAVAWRATRARAAQLEPTLAAVATCGILAAVAVAGLFDAVLLLALPLGVVAVTVGALLPESPGATSDRDVPMVRSFLLVLVAVATLRSAEQNAAYLVAGPGTSRRAVQRAVRIDPFSYPLQISLGARGPCRAARPHARAALRLAPTWPAAIRAARRC
jgi:O-antigen ligase